MRRLLVLTALPFVFACPDPNGGNDGGSDGGSTTPEITSVSPTRGPLTGGTSVSVLGANFVDGATVKFGDRLGNTVLVATRRTLSVRTPAGAGLGTVDVTITNPDGQSVTLPAAFTYEAAQAPMLDEAKILNPLDGADTSGAAQVRLSVATTVAVLASTPGPGRGAGISGQVGFATTVSTPVAMSDFTWVDSAYAGDVDGPTLGDKQRDAYNGDLNLPGATGANEITYTLAARFSLNDGATWALADADGLANGVTLAQLPKFRVGKPAVDWCKLGGEVVDPPPQLRLKVGAPGVVVYGQVYLMGVTTQTGAGTGVTGELGYGPAGADPATWTWAAATFNRDTQGGANDEFMATLPNPGAGTYAYAFRFRLNGGPARYCDADGLSVDGFTIAQAGTLTVTPIGVDSCNLQFPSSITARQGTQSPDVFGRVFAETITEAAGAGAGITGELGYGPPGDLPSAGTWSWGSASYNVEVAGGGEEYRARITAPAPGAYAYGFRFRHQGGAWSYCDLDGSANGFSAAQAGTLTAVSNTAAITSCKLQFVDHTSVASGDPVIAYGRVLITGQTSLAGALVGLRGQMGVGTQGDDASASAQWGWKEAAFNVDVAASGEDEFVATVQPAYSGTRAVAFRASVDDGASWTYCDLDGSGNGYAAGQQHALAVGNPAGIDYCALKFPATINQPADGGTLVYGQLYIPGITPVAGADPQVFAQLGWGKKVEDPGLAWTWINASYNPGCTTCGANNDEYQAELAKDGGFASGTHHYAFRFTRSNGSSWCFGDLDGAGAATGGFNGDAAGPVENLGVATIP
jgi:IPT/TIG domain